MGGERYIDPDLQYCPSVRVTKHETVVVSLYLRVYDASVVIGNEVAKYCGRKQNRKVLS